MTVNKTRRFHVALAVGATSLLLIGSAVGAAFVLRPLDGDVVLDRLGRGDEIDIALGYSSAAQLAAVANDSGEPALNLVDVVNGSAQRLPLDAAWTRRPVLSPDAHWLSYHELDVVGRSWERKLYLMDLRSQAVRLIRETKDPEFVSRAVFSPDSTLIAYELIKRLEENRWHEELRLFDVRTGADRRLFERIGSARAPVFAADGQSVYFMTGACLRNVSVVDGSERRVACVAGGTFSSTTPDLPVAHPDGKLIAFPVEHSGCTRIAVAHVDRSEAELVTPKECATHPVWLEGASPRLAYVQQRGDGSRVPRWMTIDRREGGDLGFAEAIAYDLAPTKDGGVIALLGAPGIPRSLWRLQPGAAPRLVYSTVSATVLSKVGPPPVQVMVAADNGATVPMRVFPSSCRSARPRPAVLFLHGGVNGIDDIAPRIYPEISYLNAMGVTVFAPNFRGSTGYGAEYRKQANDHSGQLTDVLAALRYIDGRADVDPGKLFVFGSCYGSSLTPGLVAAGRKFAGAIDWVGSAPAWLTAGWSGPAGPPVLWLNGRLEHGTESYAEVAAKMRSSGGDVDFVNLEDHHWILSGDARAAGLDAVRRFIGAHADLSCRP